MLLLLVTITRRRRTITASGSAIQFSLGSPGCRLNRDDPSWLVRCASSSAAVVCLTFVLADQHDAHGRVLTSPHRTALNAIHIDPAMSFTFQWPRFSDQFHADAIQMLNNALNKGNKPPVIADKIEVVELEMGTQVRALRLSPFVALTVS